MPDKDYTAVLLEEIRDRNNAVLELLRDIPTRSEFGELKQAVADVKQDMKTVKAAVTDMSDQIADGGLVRRRSCASVEKAIPGGVANRCGRRATSDWFRQVILTPARAGKASALPSAQPSK
jgi:hypothetical protein